MTNALRREAESALSSAYGDSYSSPDVDVVKRPAFDGAGSRFLARSILRLLYDEVRRISTC